MALGASLFYKIPPSPANATRQGDFIKREVLAVAAVVAVAAMVVAVAVTVVKVPKYQ